MQPVPEAIVEWNATILKTHLQTIIVTLHQGEPLQDSAAGAGRTVRRPRDRDVRARDDESRGLSWWVVACGRPLDPDSFEAREAARELLRQELADHGVRLEEYVWVWDDSNRAQVVVSSHDSPEEAARDESRLRHLGLNVRTIREIAA
jgi:hypothetical protein